MSISSNVYRTVSGDTVDGVLWEKLGRSDDAVEAEFWRLNPDAADKGPIFPSGVTLVMPERPAEPVIERVSIWD